mmetsp:Transcript_8014/g.17343  ORF Transcript_8014/g.17343 Transcript_8014/m.17343 type:complete len:121 (-) Transcript_8014:216-578(-)
MRMHQKNRTPYTASLMMTTCLRRFKSHHMFIVNLHMNIHLNYLIETICSTGRLATYQPSAQSGCKHEALVHGVMHTYHSLHIVLHTIAATVRLQLSTSRTSSLQLSSRSYNLHDHLHVLS